MMSLQVIESMSRKAARESAARGEQPLVIELSDCITDEVLIKQLRSVPFLGNRTPRGFKKLSTYHMKGIAAYDYPYEELFVDLTGGGYESEPALTQRGLAQAIRHIVLTHGAIAVSLSEVGQFQGHLRIMLSTKKGN